MTNTQTHILTSTCNLKGGDFLLIEGEVREVFDTIKFTGQSWIVEVFDVDRSRLDRFKGPDFIRVVR